VNGVTDTDLGYEEFKAMLKDLDGLEVTAGIHEGLEGEGGGSVDESSETIATYAAANEYGTDDIPARPWLRTACDANTEAWQDKAAKQLKRALAPGGPRAEKVLVPVGNQMRNDLVKSIKDGDWEPNAPSTVERKGSSKPLVDTGAMQRAITHKVTRK